MLIVKKNSLKWFCITIFCIAYGFLFTLIPHELFKDRNNYMTLAKYANSLISDRADRSLVSSEILFLYINKYLGLVFTPENVVYFFVFFINFSLSLVFFKRGRNLTLAILGLISFFLLPFGFTFQLGALRQSIATVIVMLTLLKFKTNYWVIFTAIIVAGFIHTSLFVLLIFLAADYIFLKKCDQSMIFSRILMHAMIAITMSFLLNFISNYFGVSKLDMYLENSPPSGHFFIFFIPLLVFNIYEYKNSKTIDVFGILAIIGSISYLTFYLLTPIAGRLITMFIPFIYLSLLNKFKIENLIVLFFTIFIGIYLFHQEEYKAIMTIY